MRKLIVLVAAVLVLGLGYSAAQQREKPHRPKAKLYPPVKVKKKVQVRALDAIPAPSFPVFTHPDLDADTKALHEKLAAQLSMYTAVPEDRLRFFSAVLAQYRITGWAGMLDVAEPIPGGYLVTVRVTPDIEPTDELGPFIAVGSRYAEQYRIVNGIIQYVGSLDPENMAGKMPAIMSS